MPMLTVTVLCLLFLGWLVGKPYYIEHRREQLRRQDLPPPWRDILQQHAPLFGRMPTDLQIQLQAHMQVFLAEKKFIGCAGLEITDAMRVTIAAHACLLLLNRKTGYYPKLERILVYPGAFIVDKQEIDESGVLSTYRDVLSGESWGDGQVLLAWEDVLEDVLEDAQNTDDGRNVVIHEFAHQLDQEKGKATGAPILARVEHYQPWSKALGAEYEQLQQQADAEQESLFDYYGAEHPAEFFAVVSEVFFERPQEMADMHPELYRELQGFYRVDPARWMH